MLYLVATPIGNLSDITFRAIETLKHVDYILCEDTRHSQLLLKHYSISKPLKSFHKFNEATKEDDIINDLLQGKNVALVSDAGTPGISDPGEQLTRQCVASNIPVMAIPGACAAIVALSSSGLSTGQFQFYGFLPRKTGELKSVFKKILQYEGTTICYESPTRLINALSILSELDSERVIVVARELTKKFEEISRGTSSELLKEWQSREVLGEIILMISGKAKDEGQNDWESLSSEEHVTHLQQQYKLSKNEAIKIAAEMRGVPKREVYNALHKKPIH